MDPLRGEVKKLLEQVKSPILEREDIIDILDGRLEKVIDKHTREDLVYEQVIDQVETSDMIDNIDFENITIEQAKQIIYSFGLNYDEQAVKNIEDLRKKTSKKSKKIVKEYDDALAYVNKLKEQFDL